MAYGIAVKCPKCGYDNEASTTNCVYCGINLSWALENREQLTAEAGPGTKLETGSEQEIRRRRLLLERTATRRIAPSPHKVFLQLGIVFGVFAIGVVLVGENNPSASGYAILGTLCSLGMIIGYLVDQHRLRMLNNSYSETVAEVIDRYHEKNAGATVTAPLSTRSEYVITVQFEVHGERVQLRAWVHRQVYRALEDRDSVVMRYANANPHIALLEGEFRR